MTAAAAALLALSARAHSVAFSEDFNGNNWLESFTLLELDHKAPLANFNPLFQDGDGVSRPWWRLKDAQASDDGFIGSHSAYQGGGKSNDWLVTRAIEIPTEGYNLTFGAESYTMRQGDRLSDLWVFITEYQPTEGNLPSEPVLHIEKVSTGKYPDDIEKDFTDYEINLDSYAGKTIYISFANLNEDKDILCLDNILVQRLDPGALSASSSRYVEKGEFSVEATVSATTGSDLRNWKLLLEPGNGTEAVTVAGGDSFGAGKTENYTAKVAIAADQTCNWTLTLTADNMQPVVVNGTVTGLAFIPWHNVLLEEATGIWCGNCPLGIYAIENMSSHPEMKDYVIPVALHVLQGGEYSDCLYSGDYAYQSGLSSAPTMRIDRSREVTMFSIANDGTPIDLNNTLSVAHKVKRAHEQTALFGIDVKGEFVTTGADTTAVKATVNLRPAMTLPGKNYKVGFILAENNVGLDSSPMLSQTNYFAGYDLESKLGGFTELPEHIPGWRYQDVARNVYDFHGHRDITLPETAEMDKELSYTVTLPIPDTRRTLESNGKTIELAPSVVASNLVLVAFILDETDGFTAVNSAAFPMTEQAERKVTIAQLVEKVKAGVGDIEADVSESEPVYYNLQGIRVDNPEKGLFIKKQGQKTTKVIL